MERVEGWLPGAGGGGGGMGDAGRDVEAFSYKVNKFWGSNVQ